MKKSGFFRGIFDGLRSTVSQPSTGSKSEFEIDEQLKSEQFQATKIVRHGFPYQPTVLAFDPVQRLIAIGTKNGCLRILGRPGVDIHLQHVTEFAVIQLMMVINEGQLVSVCADDSLHLWNLRSKPPEILHSLKFQKERITHCYLAFQSKWLYIGTERGNVHVVQVESFSLSGYVINWNKAIEISRKTHPGAIVHLSECPIDNSKLLIGFDSGSIVFWDLRNKAADFRTHYSEGLKSISWHHEGRQFLCSHTDGSLTTWNIKNTSKPISIVYPHAKVGRLEACCPIYKCEWKTVRSDESFIIFSGGLPFATTTSQPAQSLATAASSSSSTPTPKSDKANGTQSLTVIHGKTTTVLEMEHNIIDFVTLCESPWESDFHDPYAIVVLLYNDLVVVDLTSPGYPCFQNPYSMDLHESPVTYCLYLADCPSDLIAAFYSVGFKGTKRSGFSEKEWPINGGEWGTATLSYPEIIITGHADGSLKFWDASSVNLQLLYKLKTAKIFEKPKLKHQSGSSQPEGNGNNENDDPFAIDHVVFCSESRYLCVAGSSSQVIVFRFVKQETHTEIPVLEVPMNFDVDNENDAAPSETEISSGVGSLLTQGSGESHESSNYYFNLKVKSGHHKRPAGFQPEMVCLSPWIDVDRPPFRITALSLNVSASLLAYGCENGLILVDLIQKCTILNVATSELYGTADPYQRTSRNIKKQATTGFPSSGKDELSQNENDRCKSPTSSSDQPNECQSPEQSVPNTPFSPKTFELPIPPPRTKRKSSLSKALRQEGQNDNSQKQSVNDENELNDDLENVSRNERPSNLQLNRKDSGLADQNAKLPKCNDSDEQSLQSLNSSSLNSPCETPTCDVSEVDFPKINKTEADQYAQGKKKKKCKIIDLRSEERDESVLAKIFNKIDSSFSRSRSSSIASLENVTAESVQCLLFAETFPTKSDATSLCLWVGTSLGSVLVIALTLPENSDNRVLQLQEVVASPSGSIYRLKGSILCISFLDCTGSLLQTNPEPNKSDSTTEKRSSLVTRTSSGSSSVSATRNTKISPTSSANDMRDSQFAVLVSEKQVRIVVLPSQVCIYKQILTETSFAVRADVVYMKNTDSLCLATYLGTGNILVFSLPSLRPLMDADFMPLVDVRIARTICFSNNGHGMFLSSPSELTKFTISAPFSENIGDMIGSLFITKEVPEQPKPSFLKGLFGGGSASLDREELFGETTSGKPSKTTARHIPGSMEQMKQQTGTLGAELSRVREGLSERGERLNQIEDRTARMMTEAEVFGSAAHNVMLKYRDKKWYQF